MGVLNVTPGFVLGRRRFLEPGRGGGARASGWWPRAPTWSTSAASRPGPGAPAGAADEELRRVDARDRAARRAGGIPISIDTSKAAVARARDRRPAPCSSTTSPRCAATPSMAGVVAESGADVCLVHMRGEPRTMQDDPRYDDVVSEVRAFLEERLGFAVGERASRRSASGSTRASASARRSSTTSSCCAAWTRSSPIGRPVVVGASRKRFLGSSDRAAEPDRVAGRRGGERAGVRARGPHVPGPRRGARPGMP